MLYYNILHYIILFYTLYYFVYYIILHYLILYYIILYYIIFNYIIYFIILHYILLYYFILYYIVLYCIISYYFILYYIILHSASWQLAFACLVLVRFCFCRPHLRQRVPSSHDLIDGMSHAARRAHLQIPFGPRVLSCREMLHLSQCLMPINSSVDALFDSNLLFFLTWCSEAQQPVATILSNIEPQQRSTSRGPTIVRLEIGKCSSRSVCNVQTCQTCQHPFDIIQTPHV